METNTKENFSLFIKTIEKSADELRNQNKEQAQKIILAMSDKIRFLHNTSNEIEIKYKDDQQIITAKLCEIIENKASIRQNYQDIQKTIQELTAKLTSEDIKMQELDKHIKFLNQQLAIQHEQLAMHKRKLDEINDTSALSILRSIFCLGLDRAIMGMDILINNDLGAIESLQGELFRHYQEFENDQNEMIATNKLMKSLCEKKMSFGLRIADLQQREADLQQQEKAIRNKLTFFTNVALFYGKLKIMLDQINHRIVDVIDIVEELNDNTTTIIDFDGSGEDLISLRQALEKFDEFLNNNMLVSQ